MHRRSILCRIGIHAWSPWEKYVRVVPERRISRKYVLSAHEQTRQRRTCRHCGREQHVTVDEKVLP